MLIGVGTDIVEIGRIEKALSRKGFSERVFTEEERRQSRGRASFLAGCFAVKEAVAKCLGTGFRKLSPYDIEVLRDAAGKPYVRLSGGAEREYRRLKGGAIEVSISDTEALALAFAVLETAPEKVKREEAARASEEIVRETEAAKGASGTARVQEIAKMPAAAVRSGNAKTGCTGKSPAEKASAEKGGAEP